MHIPYTDISQAVGSSAVSVNRFNLRPDPTNMGSDAVGTKTDGV